jgi:two-component system, OmpR family, sensor histidine kinase SenX3
MTSLMWFLSGLAAASAIVGATIWISKRKEPSPGESRRKPTSVEETDDDVATEVLERIGEGVLLLDDGLRPRFANAAARHMLGFRDPWLPKQVPSDEILSLAREAAAGSDTERSITVMFPMPMTLKVRATRLAEPAGILVALQDITQEIGAQRVRREFVTNASHELKSPVAGLQTLAEAVAAAVADDPATVERFSRRMVAEADRLSRLIADLLDLSRLEEQPVPPSTPVSLSIVARGEIETVISTAQEKSIALNVAVEPNVRVVGDEQQLGLLVRNLLENAVRYTPESGTVGLRVHRHGSRAVVEVEDDGIGIPAEAQDRIFERFYRVDRARSRQRGGTGLGLAIVKHVAELHGGELSVESELDRGSTFAVRLPLLDHEPHSVSQGSSSTAGGAQPSPNEPHAAEPLAG